MDRVGTDRRSLQWKNLQVQEVARSAKESRRSGRLDDNQLAAENLGQKRGRKRRSKRKTGRQSGIERKRNHWVLSHRANVAFTCAVLIQAIALGVDVQLELSALRTVGDPGGALQAVGGVEFYVLLALDLSLNVTFILEYCLRCRALGWSYALSFRGVFDAALNVVCAIYVAILITPLQLPGDRAISAARSIRLLRLLRIECFVQIFPELALIVEGLISSFFTITYAMIVLGVLVYAGALLCADVLQAPLDTDLYDLFGTVPRSLLTHVELVLVEDWPVIGATIFDSPSVKFEWAWAAYLVLFICVGNFALLNLITGVVCENFMKLAEQRPASTAEAKDLELLILQEKALDLFQQADKDSSGLIPQAELLQLLNSSEARCVLQRLQIGLPSDLVDLRSVFDDDMADDRAMSSEQLQHGLLRLRGNERDPLSSNIQCTVRKCWQDTKSKIKDVDQDIKSTIEDSLRDGGARLFEELGSADDRLSEFLSQQEAELNGHVALRQQELGAVKQSLQSLEESLAGLQLQSSSAMSAIDAARALNQERNKKKGLKVTAETQTEDAPVQGSREMLSGHAETPRGHTASRSWGLSAPRHPVPVPGAAAQSPTSHVETWWQETGDE